MSRDAIGGGSLFQSTMDLAREYYIIIFVELY